MHEDFFRYMMIGLSRGLVPPTPIRGRPLGRGPTEGGLPRTDQGQALGKAKIKTRHRLLSLVQNLGRKVIGLKRQALRLSPPPAC